MTKKIFLFELGGIFFIITGAIGIFFWIVSIIPGGVPSSPIPSIDSFSGGSGILLRNVLITVGFLTASLGFTITGLIFSKIPEFLTGEKVYDIRGDVNRLKEVLWKVLQHVKEEK